MLITLLDLLTSSKSNIAIVFATAVLLVLGTYWTRQATSETRHLKCLIPVSHSNVADQYDTKYNVPENGERANTSVRVKALFIHPIKSCKPIELERALLTKYGFEHDRCFAFANEDKTTTSNIPTQWKMISQRTKPLMSQIHTELWLPHKKSNPNNAMVQSGGCLAISFPDPEVLGQHVRFLVPLLPTAKQMNNLGLKLMSFGIHGREARGIDMGTLPAVVAALPKLKKFLHIPDRQGFTLLRCTPDTLTQTEANLAPPQYVGSPSVIGYSDEQPLHLTSLSSAHLVSKLLPEENQPLSILRFRANIVVSGASAFAEDTWKRLRVKHNTDSASNPKRHTSISPTISLVCHTGRCTMPNVNPETGVPDRDLPELEGRKGKPQPSTTMVEQRMIEPKENMPGALGFFGVHGVPEDSCFEEARKSGLGDEGVYVQVGDVIEVLEKGEHAWGKAW